MAVSQFSAICARTPFFQSDSSSKLIDLSFKGNKTKLFFVNVVNRRSLRRSFCVKSVSTDPTQKFKDPVSEEGHDRCFFFLCIAFWFTQFLNLICRLTFISFSNIITVKKLDIYCESTEEDVFGIKFICMCKIRFEFSIFTCHNTIKVLNLFNFISNLGIYLMVLIIHLVHR